MTESYQGVGPDFLPYEYAQNLAQFCKENDIPLIFDEVQSGFGRTGKMFTYEHYDIVPDLIACGKGISSSLTPFSSYRKKRYYGTVCTGFHDLHTFRKSYSRCCSY